MNVICMGFPGSSCNAEDPSSIPGLGSSPEEGIGYPLRYFWASLVAQMVKNLPAMSGDLGSIPGLGRSLEEGMATPSSILAWRILMDRGVWQAAVDEFTKSQTRLSRAQYNMHLTLTTVWEGR